ncbi:4a-hydroxytetrahydrobiopterin dehydratase [Endozoicomonas elysicola]|uniref:4a-hydroxytetrahydrobiopterin dehydratase n=1 Tax=Endozoicomonas elysicola TaxID=305900 RepID=UPI0003603B1A|nr:4a-hydroxytetrahydrobiopterin dehydratase [Endozoicomonas elysicola]
MSEWISCQYDNIDHIEKTFVFKKYSRALAFCNAIACLAEAHIHHPRIVIEWGRVSVAWGTHQSDEGSGVLAIDKALAQRCDALYEQLNLPLS